MEHRTYGETKNCNGCRYWSEMLARCDGGPVLAYCLAPDCRPGAAMGGKWTAGYQKCEAWASGELGAIDEPGADPDRYDDLTPNAKVQRDSGSIIAGGSAGTTGYTDDDMENRA